MFNIKRILSLGLAVLVIASMQINVFALENVDDASNITDNQTNMEIQDLLDKRAEVLSQENIDINQLNAIDISLHGLGVEFLSPTEVNNLFLKSKNNIDIERVITQVSPPTSNKNTWMSWRSDYTYNGVVYNAQSLVAQPKSSSSRLSNIGSRTITFGRNWKAGAYNVISSVATSAAGNIPGASLALGFYDAVKSFVTGINTTTEVDVPHVTYSWSNTTTAMFTYIRKKNESDDSQILSLVSTKTVTAVGYQIPTFAYKNSNGTFVMTPKVIQGNRTINATPTGYGRLDNAVMGYNAGGGPRKITVGNIRISGPESNTVQTIYPCNPQFPDHCE